MSEGVRITDHVGDWEKWIRKQMPKGREYQDYALPEDVRYHTYTVRCTALEVAGAWGIGEADRLRRDPDAVEDDIRDALRRLAPDIDTDRQYIRFVGLRTRTPIRAIREDSIGHLLAVEGIIRKATEIRPRITSATFRCLECGTLTPPYKQEYGRYIEPYRPCHVCEKRTHMLLVPELSRRVDSQKIRIQESPEGLRGGEQPRTLDVELTADLAGSVHPGQRVIITGILRATQKVVRGTKTAFLDLHLEGAGVEILDGGTADIAISEEDEEEIKRIAALPDAADQIIASIAPTIYGYEDVKEAVALQLCGGVVKNTGDTRIRGDIHILLCGDPGIAKSQLLGYVSKISPRGISTSGKSATAAGLTASAVKDDFGDGGWTLEAGALVLADGGMACVDELDKMGDSDRSALHSAMEQQKVPINKAGLNTVLSTRCALLAAANPKAGRFDPTDNIGAQINMPPSLLSRFDLLFVLTDTPETTRDAALAEHIVKVHRAGEQLARGEVPGDSSVITPPIPPEMLQKYIAYSHRITPVLTEQAGRAIYDYYLHARGLASGSAAVAITPRQEEALVRLTEASARMRLSEEATAADAGRAIHVLDACLRQIAYDARTGAYDIDRWVSGISQRQRDLIRSLTDAIIAVGGDRAARRESVTQAMRSCSYTSDQIDEAIRLMTADGTLIEPRPGLLMLAGPSA